MLASVYLTRVVTLARLTAFSVTFKSTALTVAGTFDCRTYSCCKNNETKWFF